MVVRKRRAAPYPDKNPTLGIAQAMPVSPQGTYKE
jgi:hypothetical protein